MVVPWFSLTLRKIVKGQLPREGVRMYLGLRARLLPVLLCVCAHMAILSRAQIQEHCLVATVESLRASQKRSWFSQECGGKMKGISHEAAGCSRLPRRA